MIERKEFWRGCKASLPLLAGMLPFAMIAGATATELEMPLWPALSISLVVFAGAAQLTMLALMQQDSPVLVIIITALVINLRFMMYSAAMAPYLEGLSTRRKLFFSYLLTDQAFLLSAPELSKGLPNKGHSFFLGTALALWFLWQVSCVTGVLIGKGLPPSWELDFAVPLSFLAMLVPTVKSRPALAAALTAGISMLWTHKLPLHLGLIASTVLGVAAGLFFEGKRK